MTAADTLGDTLTQGPVCNVWGQVNDTLHSLNVLQCIAVYDACDTDMAPGVTTQWSVMQIYGNEKGHYYECLLFISVKNS